MKDSNAPVRVSSTLGVGKDMDDVKQLCETIKCVKTLGIFKIMPLINLKIWNNSPFILMLLNQKNGFMD